jgi:hypothetical protein
LITPQGRPVRVDVLPGTDFGVAYLPVSPTVSGLAIGSMVAGIGATVVALIVTCFGLIGAGHGWGPLVAGAFAILAAAVGAGGLASGLISSRQIRTSGGRLSGRGFSLVGTACGAVGLGLAALGVLLAILVR